MILLYVNNERWELQPPAFDPRWTLSDLLRYRGIHSAKLGCGEGGCGACVVEVRQYQPTTSTIRTWTVNSCLVLAAAFDGCALYTSEGLGNSRDGWHPVQERLVGFFGSQCGYCSAGFVVATHAKLLEAAAGASPNPAATQGQACPSGGETCPKLSDAQIQHSLDGNLCRCTGYRPIIDCCKSLLGGADIEDLGLNVYKEFKKEAPAYSSGCDPPFPAELRSHLEARSLLVVGSETFPSNGATMVFPGSVEEALRSLRGGGSRVVAGNTGAGVFKNWPTEEVLVSLPSVQGLGRVEQKGGGLHIGACVTIAALIAYLDERGSQWPGFGQLAEHLGRIASGHVRNAATVGGNLVLAKTHGLESDLATTLWPLAAEVTLQWGSGQETISLEQFLTVYDTRQHGGLGVGCLLTSVSFPLPSSSSRYWSYKLAPREQLSCATVNMAVLAVPNEDSKLPGAFQVLLVCVGYATAKASHKWRVQQLSSPALLTQQPLSSASLRQCLAASTKEVESHLPSIPAMVQGLLYKALLSLSGQQGRLESLTCTAAHASKQQLGDTIGSWDPISKPVGKQWGHLQVAGEAHYTGDMPAKRGSLYAKYVLSPKASGILRSVDVAAALEVAGVVGWVDASDVPKGGQNLVMGMFELGVPVFAEKEVEYVGQPVGLLLGENEACLREAVGKVVVIVEGLGAPIITIEDAVRHSSFHQLASGATAGSAGKGDAEGRLRKQRGEQGVQIVEGEYHCPQQQHFYMEPNAAIASVDENRVMHITAPAQLSDDVTTVVAAVLNLPQSKVKVLTRRVGGAFGGKSTRPQYVAAAAAVAAHKVKREVRLVLSRDEDFIMFGGRPAIKASYQASVKDGVLSACSVSMVIQLGWYPDIVGSPAAVQAAVYLYAMHRCYSCSDFSVQLQLAKCNLPTRTIMRGPFFWEGHQIMEHIMDHVAAHTGLPSHLVRQMNLEGDVPQHALAPTCVGYQLSKRQAAAAASEEAQCLPAQPLLQPGDPKGATQGQLQRLWTELKDVADFDTRAAAVAKFNASHTLVKRGLAMQPQRYDMSDTSRPGLVHIYPDGSVLLGSAGVECGQGLLTKVSQVAAAQLTQLLPEAQRDGIAFLDKITVADHSTELLPHSGPTAASTTGEAASQAIRLACQQLVARLRPLATSLGKEYSWEELIAAAMVSRPGDSAPRVALSALAWWDASKLQPEPEAGVCSGGGSCTKQTRASPADLGSDDGYLLVGADGEVQEEWKQLVYPVYGVACCEVEVDTLTGEKRVVRSDILLDLGVSLNPGIDMGQAEGGFVQGLGAVLLEEVVIDPESGVLLSGSTWSYKVPVAATVPGDLRVNFSPNSRNVGGVYSSKAIGEPPLILSLCALSAVRAAVSAALTEGEEDGGGGLSIGTASLELQPPATIERVKGVCGSLSLKRCLENFD